jgi:hypothetical protein
MRRKLITSTTTTTTTVKPIESSSSLSSPFQIPKEIWSFISEFLDIPSLFFFAITSKLFYTLQKATMLIAIRREEGGRRTRAGNHKIYSLKHMMKDCLRFKYSRFMSFFIEEWWVHVAKYAHSICRHAAMFGELGTLKAIVNKIGTFTYGLMDSIAIEAASAGYLEILKWLKEEFECSFDEFVFNSAAITGQIPILQFLNETGAPFLYDICDTVIIHGHLEAFKWLIINGFPFSANHSACIAARRGNIDILRFLKDEKKCRFMTSLFTYAVDGGNKGTILWLKDHQCPWTHHVTTYAAVNGSFIMLKWLIENGCPFKRHYCLFQAREFDDQDFLDWD